MKKIYAGESVNKRLDEILKRGDMDYSQIDKAVSEIISAVKLDGDKALIDYTRKFDKAEITDLRVSQEEINGALSLLDEEMLSIMKESAQNIRVFYERQIRDTWTFSPREGVMLGQKFTPLERVGVYIPGGKASYPSSVLMNIIPAQVAGVESIAMVTPCDKQGNVNKTVLAAAAILGITEIYKVGGAQSIAALAYGTQTIQKADKVVGPGNIYVARAKKMVYGDIDIDMIAGPSEICVVASTGAKPEFIAADLLSQAEHDEMASAILVTDDEKLAEEVIEKVYEMAEKSQRKDIVLQSLESYGYAFITGSIESSIALANKLAPEHLELMLENPQDYLPLVRNAGAVFLGEYTPEAVGDYFAGPSHTLPTSGTARFSSGLGVDDFVKRTSILRYERQALLEIGEKVSRFAKLEGLGEHANSVEVRLEYEKKR